MLGTGDEVGEGVSFLQELPVFVPRPAQIAAAVAFSTSFF
jgi:hypothetical protein